MNTKDKKPAPPVKRTQAPLDENPLAKPDKTKKDLKEKGIEKSKTMKDDDWKI